MAFGIREVAAKKKRAPKKPIPPIFERAKAQALKKLDNDKEMSHKEMGSLQQAIYRYETGPANKNAYASYNWKLPQGAKSKIPTKDNPKNIAKDELLEVRIKAGGVAVKCLKDEATGAIESMMLVPSKNLVAVLQDMLAHLKAMSKDSDTGLKFHKVAIRTAKPKFAKGKARPVAYCAEADQWRTFTKGKTQPERQAERDRYVAKNGRAAHWANK
jgi:hypothetical protein